MVVGGGAVGKDDDEVREVRWCAVGCLFAVEILVICFCSWDFGFSVAGGGLGLIEGYDVGQHRAAVRERLEGV